MCCVLLRPLWRTASPWIMTTSSVAVLMAPCGFLTLWTFTLSPRCRSLTSWEQTSQVWLKPGTMAWVEERKGKRESLWGLELFPRPWPSGACSFYGFKLAGCCRSPWVVVALPCMAGLQSQAGCWVTQCILLLISLGLLGLVAFCCWLLWGSRQRAQDAVTHFSWSCAAAHPLLIAGKGGRLSPQQYNDVAKRCPGSHGALFERLPCNLS